MIPILELKTQYSQIQEEVQEAVCRVLNRTQYILGPELLAFEQEFAEWNGSKFAAGVASGTDALELALRALGVGSGDEVICPPFTFVASAGAASYIGAVPVFVDIEPDTFNINPRLIEEKITSRTKAIQAVHLYGHPADMDAILEIARKHNLPVVEDCAQATGAEYKGKKVGTIGDVGCFSFFPSKNLGGVGDGGMVITSRSDIDHRIRSLRGHGSVRRYFHDELGTNSRLDEIQAAVLRVKLHHLDRWNSARRAVAHKYVDGLAPLAASKQILTPIERPVCRHVYHQFTVRAARRDQLLERLTADEIGAVIYYPRALHLQPVYQHLGHKLGDFPETERAQDAVISLPMYPELTDAQVQKVMQAVTRFCEQPVAKAG